MKKYSEILKKCVLFDGINEEDLPKMLTCLGAKTERFEKKYTVFAEGSPAKYVGILLSGSAQTVQIDYYGNRSILSEIAVGEVFGEEFACAEASSVPVSVIANEPCEVMLINCGHILHTCANHCAFHQRLIYNLMKGLATKAIGLHQRMEVTAKRTTREKLLAYLSAQAKRTGSKRFEIPFDRQELADYLEVDRSGLSSEIGKMKKEGLIKNQKNQFELL